MNWPTVLGETGRCPPLRASRTGGSSWPLARYCTARSAFPSCGSRARVAPCCCVALPPTPMTRSGSSALPRAMSRGCPALHGWIWHTQTASGPICCSNAGPLPMGPCPRRKPRSWASRGMPAPRPAALTPMQRHHFGCGADALARCLCVVWFWDVCQGHAAGQAGHLVLAAYRCFTRNGIGEPNASCCIEGRRRSSAR